MFPTNRCTTPGMDKRYLGKIKSVCFNLFIKILISQTYVLHLHASIFKTIIIPCCFFFCKIQSIFLNRTFSRAKLFLIQPFLGLLFQGLFSIKSIGTRKVIGKKKPRKGRTLFPRTYLSFFLLLPFFLGWWKLQTFLACQS